MRYTNYIFFTTGAKQYMIEQLVKEGLFKANGEFNPSYVKKFRNSITPEKQQWFESSLGDSLSEKTHIINKGLTSKPVCKECGQPVKFVSYKEGYREYCSLSCRAKGTLIARKETNKERWGVEHPAQSPVVKARMEKTTYEGYGVTNYFKRTDLIKGAVLKKYGVTSTSVLPETKEKIQQTNIKRYGVPFTQQNESIQEKTAQTNLRIHNNACSLHDPIIAEKVSATKRAIFWKKLLESDRLKELVIPQFTEADYKENVDAEGQVVYYDWKCVKCQKVFSHYIANGNIPRCPECFPTRIQGTLEKELVDWLKDLLPKTEIILNSRRIVSPLEIDIYIPDFKLAIEFDEVYWHCELQSGGKRNNTYHIGKTLNCESQNIQLLHVLDNEWWNKKEIVKSVIKSKLGFYDTKIGARKCSIRQITSQESRTFLDQNHLQGYAPASLRYGLFLGDTLVSHLAVAKNRFKKDTYEIVRYASLLNTSVQGGLSRLWKEVSNIIPKPFTLISYVDKRYFSGESNLFLGLSFSHTNPPAYHYTKDYKSLENRMRFQKKILEKNNSIYDSNLTEWENMQINGYDRIWDCGTDVYVKEYSEP